MADKNAPSCLIAGFHLSYRLTAARRPGSQDPTPKQASVCSAGKDNTAQRSLYCCIIRIVLYCCINTGCIICADNTGGAVGGGQHPTYLFITKRRPTRAHGDSRPSQRTRSQQSDGTRRTTLQVWSSTVWQTMSRARAPRCRCGRSRPHSASLAPAPPAEDDDEMQLLLM